MKSDVARELVKFSQYHKKEDWELIVHDPRLISSDPMAVAEYLLECWYGKIFDGEIGNDNYMWDSVRELGEKIGVPSNLEIRRHRSTSRYMSSELVSALIIFLEPTRQALRDFL